MQQCLRRRGHGEDSICFDAELVYQHELRPALTKGAEVMGKIFGSPGPDRLEWADL